MTHNSEGKSWHAAATERRDRARLNLLVPNRARKIAIELMSNHPEAQIHKSVTENLDALDISKLFEKIFSTNVD